MTPRLTDPRLAGLRAQARAHLLSFTDPATATIEVRAVELVMVLEELAARRAEAEPTTPPVSR